MSKMHYSLSRRLSIGIMVLAVPIFVLALGLLYLQSRYIIHAEAMENAASLLNTTVQRVGSYMKTVETAADANAWMLEENFEPANIEAVSDRIVRLNTHVVSCSVYAMPNMFPQYGEKFSVFTQNTGDSIQTYHEYDYDYMTRLSFTKPAETGKASWGDPYIEYADGKVNYHQAIATYCRPLRQDNGRMIGVVTVDLSFSKLAELMNEAENPYDQSYYMLLDGNGRYLVHPDSTRLFRKTIFTDADPSSNSDLISLGYEMTGGKKGFLHVHAGGVENHVCYQPVPGTNWSLAFVCPASQVMKGFRKSGYIILALIFVGLFVILWLINRAVKQTMSPLKQLLSVVTSMAEGRYDASLPEPHGGGVISHLQRSFANMQLSLNRRMQALQQQVDESHSQTEALQQDVDQAQENVRTKNLFMQKVAQHMRSPLNVISGFANMLRDSADSKDMISDDELQNITSMMKSNAVNLNGMVLMLFDASETDASEALKCKKNDEVSVNALAHECILHTRTHFVNTNIEFTSSVSDTLCILTNHIYLMRTLRELLYNAAKYSDGQHIKLMVTETESAVRYTVEDVGSGIPEEQENLLFEPFMHTGDLAEGLGLGLPLAKRHAKSLGGDLIFDDSYQQGCRVTLELPK